MNVDDLMAKAAQAAESARALLARGDANGACNRAYYAMFDAARAALRAAGNDVGKTHRGVLNAFNDLLVKDGPMPKEAGRLLKHAEAFRYVADYSDNAVDLADARNMVEQAESFVAIVRSRMERPDPDGEQAPGMKP
ncbi:MAG: HEPN domain-containing protein [Betaproteobacteria bacterium]|nr:HEPN domain-containing protein [Betaproteobacteria bacterium]